MLLERRKYPLLPTHLFIRRILWYAAFSNLTLIFSLSLGMVGYHHFAELGWVDSFLNASMILTGMGPIDPMPNEASKIFAGCYALFSGIAFLSIVAILIGPILHRLFHIFHLEVSDENVNKENEK
ncbi:MAG TPA: hypothetical protein VNW99_06075 [Cytophagaceae bacterium]|jgi:hypothetical protein|nr:hypothetical protein [Cytophagaceae bacterium]